jgi:hypothetical protein
MRKPFLFLLTVVLALTGGYALLRAQTPGYLWAQQAGSEHNVDCFAIAYDGGNHIMVAYNYADSVGLSSLDGNTVSLTTDGNDACIAKYNLEGNLIWVEKVGGSEGEFIYDIELDNQGNSYICGVFLGTIVFGAGESNETTLVSGQKNDIFLAKYSAEGDLLWADGAGGPEQAATFCVAVDEDGTCSITGGFKGTITFGAGGSHETVLTSDVDYDLFLARYGTDGDLRWAKKTAGTNMFLGLNIAAIGRDRLAVTGRFYDTVTFGAGETNETVLESRGDCEIFVALFDSSGALQWARGAGSDDYDFGAAIAVDGAGNSFVTGRFKGEAVFGAGQPQETWISSAGEFDLFVAKWDIAGNLAWVRQAGGAQWDLGYSIATDGMGNCLVSGKFDTTCVFEAGTTSETSITSNGVADFYFAEYTGEGDLVRVVSGGGEGFDYADGICAGSSGSVLICGQIQNDVSFGSEILHAVSGYDGFFALWVPDVTGIADREMPLPDRFELLQNYPNPFNPETRIVFRLPQKEQVTLTVYDMSGRKVAELLNEKLEAGDHSVRFDGRNLPSGIYLCGLRAGGHILVRKMALIR